jgi:hypothetical protein
MASAFGPSPMIKAPSISSLQGSAMNVRLRQMLGRFGRCRGEASICSMQVGDPTQKQKETYKSKDGNGKKVLVAGGAGYIGSHVCTDLLMNGYDVVVLDNFMNSSPASLKRVVRS